MEANELRQMMQEMEAHLRECIDERPEKTEQRLHETTRDRLFASLRMGAQEIATRSAQLRSSAFLANSEEPRAKSGYFPASFSTTAF